MATTAAVVTANAALRGARAEARRLELLAEARDARVAWVLGDDDGAGRGDDGANGDGGDDLLSGLRACRPDILPCAPLIVGAMAMLPSRRRGGVGGGSAEAAHAINRAVRHALVERRLGWEGVSAAAPKVGDGDGRGGDDVERAPPDDDYMALLSAMCRPNAADVVLSCSKFCATMREASDVVVSGSAEDVGDDGGGGGASSAAVVLTGLARAIRGFVSKTTRTIEEHEAFRELSSRPPSDDDDDDDASGKGRPPDGGEAAPTSARRERLAASVERFVYGKCRRDIDAVLSLSAAREEGGGAGDHAADDDDAGQRRSSSSSSSSKTVGEMDAEFHERVRSLQFVSPAHLEIRCLMRSGGGTTEGGGAAAALVPAEPPTYADVDLSHAVRHIRSIHGRSSPREMLHSILMAHRGVSVALNEACGGGGGVGPPPPPVGADDVLPALILATLRARAPRLPSALRFVGAFASPSMMRGEAGYAYTSMCGAVQFLRELDVDGHLRGVALLGEEGVGEMSTVLSIGPDDFRAGLVECRRRMMLEAEEGGGRRRSSRDRSSDGADDCRADEAYVDDDANDDGRIDDDGCSRIEITARQVRDARSRGEIVDLDWALKKQREALWHRGEVADPISKPVVDKTNKDTTAAARRRQQRLNLPPEELNLPPQFSRSYSFLTAHPDNIGMRDLPQLLNEYKMLVHVTELLLNERSVWRESERKRQSRLERERLERDFADLIGVDEGVGGGELANGR